MEETKKKNTTRKNSTTKKTTTTKKSIPTKKTNTSTKAPAKKSTPATKKTTTNKKTSIKKTPTPKRTTSTSSVKAPIVAKEDLEKTIIFGGEESQNIKEVVNKLSEENIIIKDKIIKRHKGNKIMIYLLSILIGIVIVACVIYSIWFVKNDKKNKDLENLITISELNKDDEKNNEKTNKREQIEVKYSNIKTIDVDKFEQMVVEQKSMVTIISTETCYYCLEHEKNINEVAKEKNKTIYRLDVSIMTENEIDRLRNYYAFDGTPTTLYTNNGKIKGVLDGLQTQDDLTKWFDEKVK